MERCPICKARLKEDWICPRCGTDLTSPQRVALAAEWWQQQAITLLTKGQLIAANQAVEQALSLKYTPLAQALHGFLTKN